VKGRLSKQVAHDIGTSEAVVNFHRSNLMRKLNVRSLPEVRRPMSRDADASGTSDLLPRASKESKYSGRDLAWLFPQHRLTEGSRPNPCRWRFHFARKTMTRTVAEQFAETLVAAGSASATRYSKDGHRRSARSLRRSYLQAGSKP
jgi:hypothetical protein